MNALQARGAVTGERGDRSRWPWLLWAFGVLALTAALSLTFVNGADEDAPYFLPIAAAMILGYATVGAVLASRNPGNPIGWLLMAVGIAFVLGGVTDEYMTYTFVTRPGSLPLGAFAALVTNSLWLPMLAAVALLLLLFPTGRVPGPRWRWAPWTIIGATAAYLLATAVIPGPIEELDLPANIRIENPTGVDGLRTAGSTISALAGLAVLAIGIATVPALVLRYRRSRGEERQQIRWLAYVAATFVTIVIAGIATGLVMGTSFENSPQSELFFIAALSVFGIGVPVAIGVAVLRYRLYDLDLVVKKTVVFTIVAAFITLLYLGALALAAVTSIGSIAAAVLFILTFNPVRRRARSIADRVVYGKRATPFEVLSEFSANLGETYSVDDVLPRMTQLLAASTGAEDVRVWLRRDRSVQEVARWPSDASAAPPRALIGDALPSFGDGTSAFPVTHRDELLGAITVRLPANDPMDSSKERLIVGLASQAGLALRNVRLVEDLRASRRRIVAAQDARAKSLERNIHDGAQQQLVALAVKLRLLEQTIDRDPEHARGMAAQLGSAANAALEDLRDLARGIYPPLLADKGLGVALEAQARKAAMPVTVDAEGIERFRADVESAIYFSCLEALQNAAKYSGAERVSVRLSNGAGELRFEVRDDGRGFDPSTTAYGTGLTGIADRLAALGGELVVTSAPGDGTAVAGRVPVGEGAAP